MEALRKKLVEERAKREEVTKDLTEKLTEARYKLGVCEGELRGLEKGMAGKR
jgi:phosphoribosylformylglycinamidine (FGAM) synthase-like amidotransferase family enzyme